MQSLLSTDETKRLCLYKFSYCLFPHPLILCYSISSRHYLCLKYRNVFIPPVSSFLSPWRKHFPRYQTLHWFVFRMFSAFQRSTQIDKWYISKVSPFCCVWKCSLIVNVYLCQLLVCNVIYSAFFHNFSPVLSCFSSLCACRPVALALQIVKYRRRAESWNIPNSKRKSHEKRTGLKRKGSKW